MQNTSYMTLQNHPGSPTGRKAQKGKKGKRKEISGKICIKEIKEVKRGTYHLIFFVVGVCGISVYLSIYFCNTRVSLNLKYICFYFFWGGGILFWKPHPHPPRIKNFQNFENNWHFPQFSIPLQDSLGPLHTPLSGLSIRPRARRLTTDQWRDCSSLYLGKAMLFIFTKRRVIQCSLQPSTIW